MTAVVIGQARTSGAATIACPPPADYAAVRLAQDAGRKACWTTGSAAGDRASAPCRTSRHRSFRRGIVLLEVSCPLYNYRECFSGATCSRRGRRLSLVELATIRASKERMNRNVWITCL